MIKDYRGRSQYAVRVTTDAQVDPEEDRLWDELMSELEPYSASLGVAADEGLSAQMTVEADTLPAAVQVASAAVIECLAGLSLPAEVVAIDALTWEAFVRQQGRMGIFDGH